MNTKDDDELIQFLNGFNYSNPSADMFLNNDGIPTDPFLEALKSDGNLFGNQSTQKLSSVPLTHKKGVVDNLNAGRSLIHHPMDNFDDESNNKYFSPSEDSFEFENPKNNEKFKLFKSSQKNHMTEHSNKTNKTSYDEYNVKSARKKVKSTSNSKHTKNKIVNKPVTTVHIADKPTSKVPSSSQANITDEANYPKEHLYDTTELEVEAEARVKGLKLRLSGQLNTIRSLEAQLAESSELLGARNKQLAQAHARLKALEPVVSATTSKSAAAIGKEGAGRVRAAEEGAEKYRKQADQLQSRLLEEQGRRQRAEEKSRVLKEYAEKSKNRCLALESMTAESKGVVAELTQRTEKYRKAYKELAAETAAQKGAVTEREAEVTAQRLRVERTESALRNCQMELEHCREELRGVRCEHKIAVSNARQLEVQLEIVREKDATHKAEHRLRQMESSRQTRRGTESKPPAVGSSAKTRGGGGFEHVPLRPYNSNLSNEHSGLYYSDSEQGRGGRPSHNQQQQQHSMEQKQYSAYFEHPPLPPTRTTNSHEWVRHSVSQDKERSMDDFSQQMASAERALDLEIMQSNESHQQHANLLAASTDHFVNRPPIVNGTRSESPIEKRPHYIVDRSPARPPINTSNAVAFIRNRVDGRDMRVTPASISDSDRPKEGQIPQPAPLNSSKDSRPLLPRETSTSRQSDTSEVRSPVSVCSEQSSRDESRLQKLYAKVTAKSSSGSVSSKQ